MVFSIGPYMTYTLETGFALDLFMGPETFGEYLNI